MAERIYKSVEELIGRTPLMEIRNIEKEEGLEARVLVKLEYLNPAGSVKDRIARNMIQDAEEKGSFKTWGYHYRAYFRKYRYRTCFYCSFQRLSSDPDYAGDHECGAEKYPEGLWGGDRSY